MFAELHNLQYLSLKHNGLQYISEGSLSGLKNLQRIDLSFNNITFIEPMSFSLLPRLGYLHLYGSFLQCGRTLNQFLRFTKIRRISLSCISSWKSNITHLKIVRNRNGYIQSEKQFWSNCQGVCDEPPYTISYWERCEDCYDQAGIYCKNFDARARKEENCLLLRFYNQVSQPRSFGNCTVSKCGYSWEKTETQYRYPADKPRPIINHEKKSLFCADRSNKRKSLSRQISEIGGIIISLLIIVFLSLLWTRKMVSVICIFFVNYIAM